MPQELITLGLECLVRVSYSNRSAWTHSFDSPDHKIGHAVVASTLDFVRVTRKLLPVVASGHVFQLIMLWIFFALWRIMFVTTQRDFAAFRADALQDLMPAMRTTFREYKFVYNHNFHEFVSLVDCGLGTTLNWLACHGFIFEMHHQQGKRAAKKGLGVPIMLIHKLHRKMVDAAMVGMDVRLHTLGRMAPTRALRQSGVLVQQSVFDQRHSQKMFPRDGGRPAPTGATITVRAHRGNGTDVGLTRKDWRKVSCLCATHRRLSSAERHLTIGVCRYVAAKRRHAHLSAAAESLPIWEHNWCVPGRSALEECYFPREYLVEANTTILAALKSGKVKLKRCWKVSFGRGSPSDGSVRPDKDDYVLADQPPYDLVPIAVHEKMCHAVSRGAGHTACGGAERVRRLFVVDYRGHIMNWRPLCHGCLSSGIHFI